jgi:RNA polymerase sigma-70 factor (ECF subfamily)
MPGSEPLSQTEALRAGSQEAFETIFREHYAPVFAVAYRLLGSAAEAEDAAQEAFLRLYEHPLPAGRDHNLRGWLLRVTTNLAYNALRSRGRRRLREERAGAEHAGAERAWAEAESAGQDAAGGSTVVDPAAADTAAMVRAVLARLAERQVQLLLLRQAGLSYAELAGALGVAPGSIGTLLARAERAFRDLYGELKEMEHDA